MAAYKARVVHLRICEDSECQIVEGPHLVAVTAYLEVIRNSAMAISYTWGQFFRQQEVIGHHIDGRTMEMELGGEWGVKNLVNTLDDICKENAFCWIDQLCTKQDDDEDILETLAKIPDIYRTFDVVVLLPSLPCSCQYESTITGTRAVQQNVWCLNNIVYGSWFKRLWTRQELLYARNIRVRWTGSDEIQCAREDAFILAYDPTIQLTSTNVDSLISRLSPFARLEWSRMVNEATGRIDQLQPTVIQKAHVRKILQEMLQDAMHCHAAAASSLTQWMRIHNRGWANQNPQVLTTYEFAKPFMHGVAFQSDVSDDEADDEEKRLTQFIIMLQGLQQYQRSATQLRDYVIAVWIDCPGYKIPADFKEKSLAALLEDALDQFRSLHGLSCATTLPAGILRTVPTELSAIWRPSLYLDAIKIKTAMDIYGIILEINGFLSFRNDSDHLPFHFLQSVATPLVIFDFETLFSDSPSKEALQFIATASDSWNKKSLDSMMRFYTTSMEFAGDNDLSRFQIFLQMRNASLGKFSNDHLPDRVQRGIQQGRERGISIMPEDYSLDDHGKPIWTQSHEVNHVDVALNVVSGCLKLRPEIAKALGLRVMVDLGDEDMPPRLGLTSINFGNGEFGPTFTIRAGCTHTLELGGGKEILLEAFYAPQRPLQVMGIWVSCTSFSESALFGEICPHECNAWIG